METLTHAFAAQVGTTFMIESKTCSCCKKNKPLTEFYKRSSRSGYRGRCRDCSSLHQKGYYKANQSHVRATNKRWNIRNADALRAWQQNYYAQNKEKQLLASKNRSLLRRFGFTLDHYWDILKSQNGKCLICEKALDAAASKHIHADHCHVTGAFRGILCASCNKGLGHFKDNPVFLDSASRYLKERKPCDAKTIPTADI